uniref:Ig-like domain-containing protein n=1 Tax=Erpetoichthys calabaricus TaxID=27687 RepID=A0A8C4TCJ4_ERPCA
YKTANSFVTFSDVNSANFIKQPLQSVRAQLGGSVDLECHMQTLSPYNYFWIKHTPGEAPETIVFWLSNGNVYYKANDGRTRYQVMKSSSSFNLSITHLDTSALGTFYCGVVRHQEILYGTNLSSKISQPHRSVRAKLGASVDLECYMPTFFPDTYIWIKHTPGDAPKTIVFWSNNGNVSYTTNDGSTRYQVMKSSSSLNLSITHINTSDLGTYYCGMVRGKVMMLGNGTEICLTGECFLRFVTKYSSEMSVKCKTLNEKN